MLTKQLVLTLISITLITGFFLLPENRSWAKRLIGYSKEFNHQRKQMDKTARLKKRFGKDYTYTMDIAELMRSNNHAGELLLMPPAGYFKKAGFNYHVPEPAVFYYFSGIKTIWADSKEAINADFFIRAENGTFILTPADNKASLQDSISAFKKLGYTL